MKTERRHELQTNWLADRVGEGLVVVKPYMKAVVGLLLAGLVLWAALLFMAHRTEVERRESWNKLWAGLNGGSNGASELELLAEANAKRPTTDWARLVLADADLNEGVTEWFTEKAAAHTQLDRALTMYKTVLANSVDPLIREHALYGIGQTEESLCKAENLEDARKAYEQIVTDYPTGAYFARAKQRLDSLTRESTKTRYDWFAAVQPPSHVFGKGTDKTGDNSLAFPPELEPLSQFSGKSKTPPPEPTPDTGKSPAKESKPGEAKTAGKNAETKPGETQKPADKTTEKPKSSDTAPTVPKPAENKSSDTKAADTKAADTKPPDTKSAAPPAPSATAPKPSDSKPPADRNSTPPATSDKKS
ncbi:MAG TPA: hypothetical protein VHX65_14690 [Pirellulales bacterium]|jgi:hypothetical protein|nr:hypothetical protein [Pirellulales bacterium]